jgi:diguanylate cyclase (GGDEF)-like protein
VLGWAANLKEIVRIIRKCIRTVDLPACYGGEEFTIILPETTGEKAKIVAERIRQSIGESPFALPSGPPIGECWYCIISH